MDESIREEETDDLKQEAEELEKIKDYVLDHPVDQNQKSGCTVRSYRDMAATIARRAADRLEFKALGLRAIADMADRSRLTDKEEEAVWSYLCSRD